MADLESMATNLFKINEGWMYIETSCGDVYGSIRRRPSDVGDYGTSWARRGNVFELESSLIMSPEFQCHVHELMTDKHLDALPFFLSHINNPQGMSSAYWSLASPKNQSKTLSLSYDWFMDEELFRDTENDTLLRNLLGIAESLEEFLEATASMLLSMPVPQHPPRDDAEHKNSIQHQIKLRIPMFFEVAGAA